MNNETHKWMERQATLASEDARYCYNRGMAERAAEHYRAAMDYRLMLIGADLREIWQAAKDAEWEVVA